jgi:CBS domain containing-hemolysin-like protein
LNSDSFSGLLLVLALILVRGLIVLAYNAFANVRQSSLRDMAEEGNQSASRLLSLMVNDSDLQVAYQTARTMLSLVIAAVAILGFSSPLLLQLGEMASPLAVHGLTLLVTLMLTLIFGELVPEGIGSAYATTLAMSLRSFMQILVIVLKPLTWIAVTISKAIATIFKSGEKINTVTEEEIVTLVESGQAGGSIEEEEKEMILSVLQLDETYASEVMVPRIDITALNIETSLADARAAFIRSGFSRIPLYENTIDNIKGLLYAKDLLNYWHNAGKDQKPMEPRDLMRPAYFVPETKRADDLLKELQTKRVHMAIVIDEFGGTAGIVTIENIIEEIIGDIQDEHDPFEEAEYLQESDNEYVVDASIDIDDFNDLLDVEVPGDDSDTLGGFVYTTLGRVPVIGEEIKHEERGTQLTIRVERVEGRRIRKLRVLIHKTDETKPEETKAEEETPAEEPANTSTGETPAVETAPAAPATPVATTSTTESAVDSAPAAPASSTAVVQPESAPPIVMPPVVIPAADTSTPPGAPTPPIIPTATTTPRPITTAAPSSDAVPVTPTEATPAATTPTVTEPTTNVDIAKPAEPDNAVDVEGKTVVPGVNEPPISSEAVPLTPAAESKSESEAATVTPSESTLSTSTPARTDADLAAIRAWEAVTSAKDKESDEDSTNGTVTATPTAAPASTTDAADTKKADAEDGTQPDQPREPISERP